MNTESRSIGSGKYLLLVGGPLLLGLSGLAIGIFGGALLSGLVYNPTKVAVDIPGINAEKIHDVEDVSNFVKFYFTATGWVVGLLLGLHAFVAAKAIVAERVSGAGLLITCLATVAILLGVAWTSGTLVGNLVSDLYLGAPRASYFGGQRKVVSMKILDMKFTPGQPREETVKFTRAFSMIMSGMIALLLCSNTFVLAAVANRAKRVPAPPRPQLIPKSVPPPPPPVSPSPPDPPKPPENQPPPL